MYKYRVVEYMDDNGSLRYKAQWKKFIFWHDYVTYWGESSRVYRTREDAIHFIDSEVREDQLRAKAKAYGKKVVYGPYPP